MSDLQSRYKQAMQYLDMLCDAEERKVRKVAIDRTMNRLERDLLLQAVEDGGPHQVRELLSDLYAEGRLGAK